MVRLQGGHRLGHRGWRHATHGIHVQRNPAGVQAHGIRTGAERRRLPLLRCIGGNRFNPGFKALQGLHGQCLHRLGHSFLLSQPGIEHLLHGPACLTKFIQPHHARAAFEGVKGTAQYRLLTQVGRVLCQRLQRSQPMPHHFTRLFQKDVQQLAVGIFGLYLQGGRCRCTRADSRRWRQFGSGGG